MHLCAGYPQICPSRVLPHRPHTRGYQSFCGQLPEEIITRVAINGDSTVPCGQPLSSFASIVTFPRAVDIILLSELGFIHRQMVVRATLFSNQLVGGIVECSFDLYKDGYCYSLVSKRLRQ